MAEGRQHQVGYNIGLTVMVASGLYLSYAGVIELQDVAAVALGGVLGMIVTPDVRDQHDKTTHSERRMWHVPILGPIAGYLFEVYWYPLARLIPHRSFLSHLPGLATGIAAAWLILPPALVVYYVGGFDDMPFWQWLAGLYEPWMLVAFIAWCVQDLIHLAQDGFFFTWQVLGEARFGKAGSGD